MMTIAATDVIELKNDIIEGVRTFQNKIYLFHPFLRLFC